MKKIIYVLLLINLPAIILGQKNDLMPGTLRVSSQAFFDKRVRERLIFDIKEHQSDSLFLTIMNTALTNKVSIYEPDYRNFNIYNLKKKPINPADVEDRMDAKDEIVLVENVEDPDGPLIEKTIKGEIYLDEIKGIHFYEEWFYDSTKVQLDKKVIAYNPVRFYGKPGSYEHSEGYSLYKKKVCELNFEALSKKEIKKSNKRLKKYATVRYEQLIYNFNEYNKKGNNCYLMHEHNEAPFFNSYVRNIMITSIFNKVLSKQKQASDFYTGEVLNPKEIWERMGAKDEVVLVENIEDPDGSLIEKIIKGEIHLYEIKSYIFTEDWYLDPVTLRIVKKVKGIAPVRYYWTGYDDKSKLVKKIIFEIKL